jgi:hypothetical protein
MRIILSHGQVNVFNLAKNAGTSVEQIERFYARNLPLSAEIADSCDAAQAYRFDAARDSWMMPPTVTR